MIGQDKNENKNTLSASQSSKQDDIIKGMTYVENAHASGDGSFKRSDDEQIVPTDEKNEKEENEY